MNHHIITWKKEYYEDLGEEDENGFLEYAYRYFIYSFYFHDKQEVSVRRYTDTMDECSIFLDSENQKDGKLIDKTTIISVVYHFMKMVQEVKCFNYFDSKNGYTLVAPIATENVLNNFSFIEII
jgi:hypothetical protein